MTTEDQAAVTGEAPSARALLVVPRLRVQNANTVSSPLTWGFPAITAFTGLMTALERRLGREAGLALHGVGVICHHFEPQVTRGGFVRSFHLTRNPVLQDGSTVVLHISARQRFGREDFGVNAARLKDWLARLGVD